MIEKKNSKYNLITILGPTAVGKTGLAVKLANEFNGEIISADSRQVYTGMDIGTGKDLEEYTIQGKTIPHHLIDVISPKEEFDVYKFSEMFYEIFPQIIKDGKNPFLAGGTGLYLSSILQKYNMQKVDFNSDRFLELEKLPLEELQKLLTHKSNGQHNTTDLLIKERIIKAIIIVEQPIDETKKEKSFVNSLVFGVRYEREEIKNRIRIRLKDRLENGMIEEVEALINKGVSHDKLNFFGLEYRFISSYLRNEISKNDMSQKLNSAIAKFAKRQMTWFRKMEKEGVQINWLDGPDFTKAKEIVTEKYL